MPSAALTLITKPGCHLCDEARAVMTEVVDGLRSEAPGNATSVTEISIEELSIVDDPELAERYAEEIPVLLLNGRVHNIWRVDPARLRAALLEA